MRRQYVGRSAAPGGHARNPFEVPASAILTGVDGVERVFGNAVVERGPWLASVGIPTSVATSRTPADLTSAISESPSLRRRSSSRCRGCSAGGGSARSIISTRPRGASAGATCPRCRRRRCRRRRWTACSSTVGSMITNLQRARESIAVAGRRRAADARGDAVAAAASDSPGAPGGDRRAGLRRGARAQQPVAGDPRLL